MTAHRLLPLLALGLNLLLLGSALAPDRRHRRSYPFLGFMVSMAVWNFGVFGLRSASEPGTALFWERVIHLGVIPMPAFFYHYALAFLEARLRRPSLVVAYGLAALFLVVSPTPLYIRGVGDTYWGYAPLSGPLYTPFFVYFQAFILGGLVWLIRGYRTTLSSFRRNRILLIVCGVLAGLAGGAVDFIRFIVGWERLYPVGIPANALFALAVGIAIVRYRLIDLGILARRLLLSLFTGVCVAATLFVTVNLVESVLGDIGAHAEYLLALLAGLTVSLPLLPRVQARLENVIFARQHGVRDAIVELARELGSVLNVNYLAQMLAEGLVARIPVMHASFHVLDASSGTFTTLARAVSPAMEGGPPDASVDGTVALWLRLAGRPVTVEEIAFQAIADPRIQAIGARLEAARVALLVPLFLEGELTAVLLVGEKVSGEIFDGAEVRLTEMLMGQTGIALRNARLYEDLRAQMDELKRTQAQLVQSAKLAAVGELAASVAHEINNPLTVILGSAELLIRRAPEDAPLLKRLGQIRGEAMRAAKIIRDLLDFARRREPNRAPVVVQDLLRRAVDLLGTKLRQARVEVDTVLDPAAPVVLGDGDQLTQVFINLIANAADAMSGGGTIQIRTEVRRDAGALAIMVVDRGKGILPEQVTRIFEPFFTTKAEGQGTGLGLPVSLGIVKNHGGTIEVQSEIGKGTTMTVLLPLSTAPMPTTDGWQ